MSAVTFEASFFGHVQGVGFRFLCLRKANEFGVRGWVRNSHKYGLVEAVLQGEKKKVDLVIDFLKSCPYGIRVDNVMLNEVKTDEKFSGFEIRY